MTKRLIVLLILTLFLLAACSGQEEASVMEAPESEEEAQPLEAAEPTETTFAEKEPDEQAVSESGGDASPTGVKMECTLVSDQPDAPAEFVAIFGVKEDDWTVGPDDAAVTFVEYGDFQ